MPRAYSPDLDLPAHPRLWTAITPTSRDDPQYSAEHADIVDQAIGVADRGPMSTTPEN